MRHSSSPSVGGASSPVSFPLLEASLSWADEDDEEVIAIDDGTIFKVQAERR